MVSIINYLKNVTDNNKVASTLQITNKESRINKYNETYGFKLLKMTKTKRPNLRSCVNVLKLQIPQIFIEQTKITSNRLKKKDFGLNH